MKEIDLSADLGMSAIWSSTQDRDSYQTLITRVDKESVINILLNSNGAERVSQSGFLLNEILIEKSSKAPRKVPHLLRNIYTGLLLIFALFFICIAGLSVTKIISFRVVLTSSMIPAVQPGDIIVGEDPSRRSPKIGDIITYNSKRFDGTKVGVTFSHRIIGGDADSGFVVKGDANDDADVQKPRLADITGVKIFIIPLLGKIFSPQIALIMLIMIFGIWLIRDFLLEDNEK